MSLLRTIILGLGRSLTPTNNFTFSAAPADGTLTLYRGNAGASLGTVLTVGADNVVTFTGMPMVQGSDLVFLRRKRVDKTATGTSLDFTGADAPPSWVERITLTLYAVSNASGDAFQLQLGGPTFVTSGYTSQLTYSAATNTVSQSSSAAGFALINMNATANTYAQFVLTRVGGNRWAYTASGTAANWALHAAGGIDLGVALERMRFTTAAGTANFDNGFVSALYEG